MNAEATCKTCPWCQLGITGYRPAYMPEREGKDGACRKNPPRHYVGPDHEAWAEWPVVDPDTDWCGEHPDRCPQVFAELQTASGSMTKDDVKNIVNDLLRLQARAQQRQP